VSDSLFPDVEAHVIDTNLFVSFERHDTVDLLERAVRAHDIVLSLISIDRNINCMYFRNS